MAPLGVEGNAAERTPKNGVSRGNRQISTSRATTTNVTKYKGRYIGNVVLRHGGNVKHLKQLRGGSKANSRRAPEYSKCLYGLVGKAGIRAGKVLSHASCEGRHRHDACSGLCRPCVQSQNMWPIDDKLPSCRHELLVMCSSSIEYVCDDCHFCPNTLALTNKRAQARDCPHGFACQCMLHKHKQHP